MAPGLRGPAVGPCNSEHTTRWGLSKLHYVIKFTVNLINLFQLNSGEHDAQWYIQNLKRGNNHVNPMLDRLRTLIEIRT